MKLPELVKQASKIAAKEIKGKVKVQGVTLVNVTFRDEENTIIENFSGTHEEVELELETYIKYHEED
jgi:hypothetical protein